VDPGLDSGSSLGSLTGSGAGAVPHSARRIPARMEGKANSGRCSSRVASWSCVVGIFGFANHREAYAAWFASDSAPPPYSRQFISLSPLFSRCFCSIRLAIYRIARLIRFSSFLHFFSSPLLSCSLLSCSVYFPARCAIRSNVVQDCGLFWSSRVAFIVRWTTIFLSD